MAMPVSKAAWFETNGNSRSHRQMLMVNIPRGAELSQNRGIGALPEAVFTLLSGANDTCAKVVPGGGMFWAVLEMNATPTGILTVLIKAGSSLTTAYSATAVPPTTPASAPELNGVIAPGPLNGPELKKKELLLKVVVPATNPPKLPGRLPCKSELTARNWRKPPVQPATADARPVLLSCQPGTPPTEVLGTEVSTTAIGKMIRTPTPTLFNRLRMRVAASACANPRFCGLKPESGV